MEFRLFVTLFLIYYWLLTDWAGKWSFEHMTMIMSWPHWGSQTVTHILGEGDERMIE